MTPLTTSAFDLPDHLAAKADPALIAGDEQHFAAIAESLEQSIADLSDRLDAERRAPGGIGQEALDRDLEIHRLTARLRTLRRFGLDLCLGRIVARGRPRAGVRRTARPHRQHGPPAAARLALPRGRAVLRRDPRQPDGPGEPPPVPLDPRPDHRLLGRGVHRRTGSTGTPPRSTTSPPSSPAWAATGRPGCATCSAPSRPTRTPSSAPGPAARSSSTAARAPARPSSPCTAPPTCSTPTRASVTTAAACCSSARTSPTWPTSPTSCRASARRACRPARCATSSPREPRPAVETDPDVARLKSSAGRGGGDRGGRPVLRGAADARG